MKVLFCFRILVQYLRFECLRDVILTLSVSFPLGALPLVQRSLYGLCCYAVEGESGQPRTSLVSFLAFSETECFKYCSCCFKCIQSLPASCCRHACLLVGFGIRQPDKTDSYTPPRIVVVRIGDSEAGMAHVNTLGNVSNQALHQVVHGNINILSVCFSSIF
jgi:hypothetical protein